LGTSADNAADMARKGRSNNGRADQTHCIHNHEFTEENTYTCVNRRGRPMRACRKCRLARSQARWAAPAAREGHGVRERELRPIRATRRERR
jgi:hypothetical protein